MSGPRSGGRSCARPRAAVTRSGATGRSGSRWTCCPRRGTPAPGCTSTAAARGPRPRPGCSPSRSSPTSGSTASTRAARRPSRSLRNRHRPWPGGTRSYSLSMTRCSASVNATRTTECTGTSLPYRSTAARPRTRPRSARWSRARTSSPTRGCRPTVDGWRGSPGTTRTCRGTAPSCASPSWTRTADAAPGGGWPGGGTSRYCSRSGPVTITCTRSATGRGSGTCIASTWNTRSSTPSARPRRTSAGHCGSWAAAGTGYCPTAGC